MAQNLLLRPSGYYFRYIIRPCHRSLLSIKELRYTLHTSSRRLANKRARAVAAKVDSLLERLARTHRVLTDKQIRETIRQYVEEAGEQFYEEHLTMDARFREGNIDLFESQVSGLHHVLAHSNFSGDKNVAAGWDFDGDIQAEVGKLFGVDVSTVGRYDIQFLKACQAWTAATKQLYEDHLKRLHGEVVEPKRAAVPSEIPEVAKGPLVSEVVEPFLSDRSKRKDIEERTASCYRQFVQLFIDTMGDVPVTDVTPSMATEWRDKLLEYPKNKTKVKAYRDCTPRQLLLMDIPPADCLSKATVNNHLVHLSTVFGDLVRLQTIPTNPFTGHELKTTQQSYNQFTPSDLDLIFTSPVYMSNSDNRTGWKRTQAHWWLLSLALSTGCRAGELAQLRLDDVAMVDGILTANIVEDKATGQRVKTASSLRSISIHPRLLELGFNEYLGALKGAGADRVLQGIALGSVKPVAPASNWFDRYRQSFLQNFKAERKTLHSTRGTFYSAAYNDVGMEILSQADSRAF
jgi:integrase